VDTMLVQPGSTREPQSTRDAAAARHIGDGTLWVGQVEAGRHMDEAAGTDVMADPCYQAKPQDLHTGLQVAHLLKSAPVAVTNARGMSHTV
jgi:hypothetical protein